MFINLFYIFCQIIFFFFITKIILLFQYKIAKPGFDHFYHLSLARNIKLNNHKFVFCHSSYIDEKNFMYPQLFHWALSFLPEKFLIEKYNRIGQLINFLTLFTFVVFAYTIYDFLKLIISRELFVFYAGLAFTLAPFNFLLWNAKNRGLSVRGLGVLLGFLYLYCIVWLNLYSNWWFYVPVFLLAFVILLSSQFTFQFILLATPFLSILYKDYWLFSPPFAAAILFLIFFRKTALLFFKGQYYHKKIWFKYLAKVEILKQRYDIYLDFVYDFFRKKDIKYFLNNPIIGIVLGFPFLSIFIFFLLNDFTIINNLYLNNYIFFIPVITALLAFFLTSFRPTRFFGEPERYVEFALPFFSILSIVLIEKYEWLITCLITFSFVYIMYHFSLFGFHAKNDLNEIIENIKKFLTENYMQEEYRLFSNSSNLPNFFIDNPKYKILFPNITTEYTGKFHFTEIYPIEFVRVSSKVIIPLIEEFEINWFILDTLYIKESEFNQLEKDTIVCEKVYQVDNLILFRIDKLINVNEKNLKNIKTVN